MIKKKTILFIFGLIGIWGVALGQGSTSLSGQRFGEQLVPLHMFKKTDKKKSLKKSETKKKSTGVEITKDTVTQWRTGLMWQKWETEEMDWRGAIKFCLNLKLEGYIDWVLPRGKMFREKFNSEDDMVMKFPLVNWQGGYWTIDSDSSGWAWFFEYNKGWSFHNPIDDKFNVRCVREVK